MKRFYTTPATEQTAEGWRVTLDGRPIKTAGGRPQLVPSLALAEALASEWALQGEEIDPRAFVMRDLVDFAIDAVAPRKAETLDELLPYAETDTLCYRADPEEALYRRQLDIWEPIVLASEARHGVTFARVSGIVHKAHPEATRTTLRAVLETHDAFTLAGLKMLSSLAASLIIALAAIEDGADAERLWKAANLEEDWQVEMWGEDAEAAANRQARFEAFQLAMRVVALARQA